MRVATLLLLPLFLGSFCCWSQAETIYNCSEPFADDGGPKPSPAGVPPWVRATFTNQPDASVLLRLDGVNLPDEQYASTFFFNFKLDPAVLTITHASGLEALTVETGNNAFKADGDGMYDVRISYATAKSSGNRFVDGSWSQYVIRYAEPLPSGTDFADLFRCLSHPSGGCGPYYMAVHIQNIPRVGDEDDSTWIHGNPPTHEAPEPGGMLFWILFAFPGLVARRRHHA